MELVDKVKSIGDKTYMPLQVLTITALVNVIVLIFWLWY